MKKTEVLLQGEGIPDIQIVKLSRGKRVKDLLAAAAAHRSGKFDGEFNVFVEDCEEPVTADEALPTAAPGKPMRLHVHRCRRVEVTVTFNGVTKEHRFGPGATVAAVKKWAAIAAFGMDPGDAAEHVLQIAGSTDRPEPDTHIGALVACPDCLVKFDLVPLKRVEG